MENRCEHCRKECWIEDNLAGTEVVCPWCQRRYTAKPLPGGQRGGPTSFTALLDSVLSAPSPSVAADGGPATATEVKLTSRARRKPRSKAKRVWLGLAVMSVAGVVIAITGATLIRRQLAAWQQATLDASHGNYVAWRPDERLLAQLGGIKTVDRFELRLPKSFTSLSVLPDPGWLPRDGHFVGLRWTGAARDRAELYCTIVTFSASAPMEGGLEEALDRFYEWLGFGVGVSQLSRGEPELGLLNGRNSIRESFVCGVRRRGKLGGVKREGVVYILLDGNRQVTLYTLCDPELSEEHDVMGASLLTWRER